MAHYVGGNATSFGCMWHHCVHMRDEKNEHCPQVEMSDSCARCVTYITLLDYHLYYLSTYDRIFLILFLLQSCPESIHEKHEPHVHLEQRYGKRILCFCLNCITCAYYLRSLPIYIDAGCKAVRFGGRICAGQAESQLRIHCTAHGRWSDSVDVQDALERPCGSRIGRVPYGRLVL